MDLTKQHQEHQDPSLFSIQHFCLHDGPGIRSIIFFKGCPLRCQWCQNPESWSKKPELAYKEVLCIDCKTCIKTCPENAITTPGKWDSDRCTLCFKCVDTCPSGALTRFGSKSKVEEVLDELRPEYPIFKNSEGGVTFSGGEVTLFSEYAAEMASTLQRESIHVTIETCGKFKLDSDLEQKVSKAIIGSSVKSSVWKLLSHTDLVLFDIKVFDNNQHKLLCGAENLDIKQNFATLCQLAKKGLAPRIWPRLPLIPGMTNSRENLENWAAFLLENGIHELSIVPYHNLGGPKRAWIGAEEAPDIPSLTDEALKESIQILTTAGITCYEPGEESW